jgi:hypothetical protein
MRFERTILTGIIISTCLLMSIGRAETSSPVWLTEASFGIKETYDDNVFASGVDSKYLPPTYVVPAGSVAALKNCPSWVTTVSPKLSVNFAPMFGKEKSLQTLSLAYAPDFVTYHDQTTESYEAHRLITAINAGSGAVSLAADNAFTFINGSSLGAVYPGALYNVYGLCAIRERREQLQNKATIRLQYDWEHCFIRPTAALLYYDLMTEQLNLPGYQNFADRYDVNGGVDLGWKLWPQFAVTLGYRYGRQGQEQFDFSPYSSPNDYQRVLLGVEGRLWNWLDVKIQVGPDFRDYADDTATHITPVRDKQFVTYYGEGNLTATFTAKDSLTFKYKQWQWLSSSGKVPYFDSAFELNYHRQLTAALVFDLGGRFLSADYSSGDLPTCRRNDLDYGVTTGLGYAFNRHLSVNLGWSLELGRNAQEGIVNESVREFSRNLVSLGAVMKF